MHGSCGREHGVHVLGAVADERAIFGPIGLREHHCRVWREVPWRVVLGAVRDALEDAQVQRRRHTLRQAERAHVPDPPAVEHAEARAGVVQLVVDVGVLAVQLALILVDAQAGLAERRACALRFGQHPVERDEREALLRVAAADVRMRPGEPDLRDTAFSLPALVPQQRAERMPFVVQRQRMAGAIDARAQAVVRKLEPVHGAVEHIGQVERQSDRINRVPDADEPDADLGVVRSLTPELRRAIRRGPEHHLGQPGAEALAVEPVGLPDRGVQPGGRAFRQLRRIQHAALGDEADEGPDRERAAAEPEDVDLVAGVVDAHELFVELADVAAKAESRHPGEDLQRFDVLGSDPIVVERDLRREGGIRAMPVEVDGLVELEDIRPSSFDRRVAGPVRADDDAFGHLMSSQFRASDHRVVVSDPHTRAEPLAIFAILHDGFGT